MRPWDDVSCPEILRPMCECGGQLWRSVPTSLLGVDLGACISLLPGSDHALCTKVHKNTNTFFSLKRQDADGGTLGRPEPLSQLPPLTTLVGGDRPNGGSGLLYSLHLSCLHRTKRRLLVLSKFSWGSAREKTSQESN